MIRCKLEGNFKKLDNYFEKLLEGVNVGILNKYGREGVAALKAATPVDTGVTAASWYYEIVRDNGSISLVFKNSNVVNHVNIAIILQYGHGTRNGGYVEGRDYINPVMASVFSQLADEMWSAVQKA